MFPTHYRPKRLMKKRTAPGGAGKPRRWAALILCVCMLLSLIPAAALASGRYTVRFVNYDLSEFGYAFSDVPEGAKLYTAEELKQEGAQVPAGEDCTWYLYYPGGGEVGSYGPHVIPDPPEREGYSFRDWVAQGASGDNIYTVTGDTVFVARYISDSQYVVNLYYQFANESSTVAAETSTVPYGYGETISIQLPQTQSLEGLSPQIAGSTQLNGMIGNGVFSGKLDDAFLQSCRDAGYVAWDEGEKDYQRDENGNVQINIPVTYTLVGKVTFKVEYLGQDPDNPEQYTTILGSASGSVDGTTHVSLNDLDLAPRYEGFTLTAASSEDADSYNINANGTSVIQLRYDRNIHYIYYQMNGGNAVDPVQLRFGQTIPDTVGSGHTRPGYEFDGWTWLDGDGNPLTGEPPTAMPDHDLTLEANWVGADTTVTLVYWLENANDDGFTVSGERKITVTSGQTVGYRVSESDQVDISIDQYLSADAMKAANIPDGEYFTFTWVDSATQEIAGQYGALKTAEGDGSTVINIGYARKEYTLTFHLGWEGFWIYHVADGGYSTGKTADDWKDGYEEGTLPLGGSPEMTIGGKTYFITDTSEEWYRIKAKYGEYISDRWPVRETMGSGGWFGLRTFLGWGTHALSPYAKKNPGVNSVINGIYSTMSADLIIDPENPNVEHHLVAYYNWNFTGSEMKYHCFFEAIPGIEESGMSFTGSDYETYSAVNIVADGGLEVVKGRRFYQYGSPMSIMTQDSASAQSAPVFANVTYQYGCYNGNDIYFFYTYDNYTATYHENNANLTNGTSAQIKTVNFHYIADKTLAEELVGFDYDYVPEPPYVSSYGNAYTFGGWYTDANLTFPVDWSTENPVSSVNFYAKWIAPTFTLKLVVPGGKLYQDSLNQFTALGYTYTVDQVTGPDGEVTTIYTVSGIPGGTKASEIVKERHGADSDYSLAFDYWGYEVNGAEQRYLFDESQLVVSDLTLTARWKTEYTGHYTVRYLTTETQENGLGTEVIDGTTYYRLLADKHVTGVAVGSSVTEEARAAEGYLSNAGEQTKVVAEGEEVYFDFFYSKIASEVTYHVHYVRDMGIDYGRTAPPPDAVFLAADKTVVVGEASLSQSTSVSEAAVVVGGYTPRDSWNTTFTLSAEEEENHLYIYYVSNTLLEPFRVVYHFQADDGSYPAEGNDALFTLKATETLGKALSAADLAVNYGRYLEDTGPLDALMAGRELDTELSEKVLLVTQQEERNVLHIYMKNGDYTLTYYLNGNEEFPASWPAAEDFLAPSADGGSYAQTVTYPGAATVPSTEPERLAYEFTGWNTAADGSGTPYTTDTLKDAPWYRHGGLREDASLYAQWKERLVVSFDLRGGTWTDISGQFYNAGSESAPQWVAYVADGGMVPQPSDPSYVLSDGTAYSFIGWTDTDPDSWPFVGGDNRVDLVEFEQHRFHFSQPITKSTVLYAVWDPDVTTFDIRKTDTQDKLLPGAEFTLERLQATVTGNPQSGYNYELKTDGEGKYIPDEHFAVRQITSDALGAGAFENLPAGYYRLTETRAPDGYTGLEDPVILFAPYDGTPEIYKPVPYVSAAVQSGDLLVTVQNISQYSVDIEAPSSLTLTYTPPDLIWNPETSEYEGVGGASGQWQVSAPEGEPGTVTVTNRSPGASVQVEVSLQYDEGFRGLLPLSSLTGPAGFTESAGETAKTLSGTLASETAAQFTLQAAGTAPPDVALPAQAAQAGTITVRVAKTNG